MGFHELVEEVLSHGTVSIVSHRDALPVDSRDYPWDSSVSSTSHAAERIVIARSPKVSRGGKREVRGRLVLPARPGGIERILLDRSLLEQDPSRGHGDEEGESEDGDRSPTQGGGPVPLSWDPSRFLDVAARDRCLFRSSIHLSAFEGLHPGH